MNDEAALREQIAHYGQALSAKGHAPGTSGNISVRFGNGMLITPTNTDLGALEPDEIARIEGDTITGKPSKEAPLHRAFYETRAEANAVVHLHSSYATALSCLVDTDPTDALKPITPYAVMRLGRVPLLPYLRPGDPGLGAQIRELGGRVTAVLLANHGPVVSGNDIKSAVAAAEEFEETAKLLIITRGLNTRLLSPGQIAELGAVFGTTLK